MSSSEEFVSGVALLVISCLPIWALRPLAAFVGLLLMYMSKVG